MYRRPQFDGSIQNPPRDADGKIPAEKLSEMLGQVSENSVGEIDNLVDDFQRLRAKLGADGERIQREIEGYTALSKQVTQLTQIIYESMGKIRGAVTH
jgi:flagellin-like hook-associated protein FlgL